MCNNNNFEEVFGRTINMIYLFNYQTYCFNINYLNVK